MPPFKKFAIGASVLMAVGVLVFVVYGYTLPTRWVVERSALIAAQPADLHPLVERPEAWKSWAMGEMGKQPDLQITTFGPEAGPGAGYRWDSSVSHGQMTLTASDPARGVAYEMVMEANDTPAAGTIAYAPEGAGTRVTWHDEGEFSKPFGGYMVGVMEQQLGAHLETALGALAAQAEQAAATRQATEAAASEAQPGANTTMAGTSNP